MAAMFTVYFLGEGRRGLPRDPRLAANFRPVLPRPCEFDNQTNANVKLLPCPFQPYAAKGCPGGGEGAGRPCLPEGRAPGPFPRPHLPPFSPFQRPRRSSYRNPPHMGGKGRSSASYSYLFRPDRTIGGRATAPQRPCGLIAGRAQPPLLRPAACLLHRSMARCFA